MHRFSSGCIGILAGMMVGVVVAAEAPASAAAPTSTPSAASDGWQQHWELMRQRHQAMLAAKTPEERAQLMQQHWESMQGGMHMLGGCPGGGMGMGYGMMGGGAAPVLTAPSPEQVDRQIEHLEQMLKELKAYRREMKSGQ